MRRLLLATLLPACPALLALAAPASGAIFDSDDRVAVSRPGHGLAGIGVVKGGKHVAYTTGFLVSDCHVLTVKHAAGARASVIGRRLRFVLPFAGREGSSRGTVVAAGALDLIDDAFRLDRSQDWLVLRLDRCLGARFGHLALRDVADSSPFRTPGREALISAGFPIDRSWREQLTVDPKCRVRGLIGAVLVHDCSALPGNSGSPILATVWRNGQPTLEVVAMQSTAAMTGRIAPFRGEDGSVATRISDILPAIRGFLNVPASS